MDIRADPWVHGEQRRPVGGLDHVCGPLSPDCHPRSIRGECHRGIFSVVAAGFNLPPDRACLHTHEHDGATVALSTPASRILVHDSEARAVVEEGDAGEGARAPRVGDAVMDDREVARPEDHSSVVGERCCDVPVIRAPVQSSDCGILAIDEVRARDEVGEGRRVEDPYPVPDGRGDARPVPIVIKCVDAGPSEMEIQCEVRIVRRPSVVEVGGAISIRIGASLKVDRRRSCCVRAIVDAIEEAVTVRVARGGGRGDGNQQHQENEAKRHTLSSHEATSNVPD